MNQDSQMKDMENNILHSINSLKDEILNLKEIVIKNFQNENEKFRQKCKWLERPCAKYESDHNALAQYGHRNNVVLSGIPDYVSDDTLKESVISVLAEIDVFVEHKDIEACHRFGKADRQKSKKTIVQFLNKKKCKKVLSNKEKPGKIDCNDSKIFASKNLTSMNEWIAYNYCKLKWNGLIHGCFSKDGIIRIKCEERARPVKIFHMDKLQLFPDFDFDDADEDDDIFLDASQVANDSTQSSY